MVCHDVSDGIAAECDQTFTYLSNGDDFFALTEAGATADIHVVVDKVGDFGDDPGSGWSVAGVSNGTKDYTLVRKSSVQSGNTDWAASVELALTTRVDSYRKTYSRLLQAHWVLMKWMLKR